MAYHCFNCGAKVELSADSRVGRRDECPSCSADLHACKNCQHYDPKAYNECKEPQAERVLEKERSNFCDYFAFAEGKSSGAAATSKEDTLKDLDDLFK